MYLGYVKRKVDNQLDYNWQKFLEHVPEALDSMPLIFMCRSFTKFWRYIDEYRVGLNPSQVESISNKYKSYHNIPANFLNNL